MMFWEFIDRHVTEIDLERSDPKPKSSVRYDLTWHFIGVAILLEVEGNILRVQKAIPEHI